MKIELTKEELRQLVKMEYLSHWMKYSYLTSDNRDIKDKQLAQKIYKLAYEAGITDLVQYDNDIKEYYTTRQLDNEMDDIIENYNDSI